MAKYNIKRVTFKAAVGELGGSSWMSHIKQAGVTAVEYDSTERMLTLTGPKDSVRIPAENVQSMVYGATLAAPKS